VKILTIMVEDWNDSASDDISSRETICKAKLANRITNALFILHVFTVLGYSIGIFLANIGITDQQSEPSLLFKVELPVNISIKYIYKTLLGMQFVHLMMSGCGIGLLNALLLALVSFS